MANPLMKYWEAPDGTVYKVCDADVSEWAKNKDKPTYTANDVGADPAGTAKTEVSQHNVAEGSHNDIRLLISDISKKLNAFFDSDDATMDQLSELLEVIKSNQSLIDAVTTSKVNVADIINNLTTNVANKPLSAAQGVVLKGLIDNLTASLSGYQPKGDYALRSELPPVPVQSVNGKTGAVDLNASDVGLAFFGTPYSSAEKIIQLSASVQMYLFATTSGYDAVVDGNGAIPNYQEANRPYNAGQINRLRIGAGITSIGDYFMYKAFNLTSLSFADSKNISHLGKCSFAYTQIGGAYEFTGLADTKIDKPFEACPKLLGLTFNENVEEIATGSFQLCFALRYVRGLLGVTSIGDAAFQYCHGLDALGVTPGNVALGRWVFILTPTNAKVDGTSTLLSDAQWKSQGSLCFVVNGWTGESLAAVRSVLAESVLLAVPESDNQGTDFYRNNFSLFWAIGETTQIKAPASGQCGFFVLYHIYNILHPNAQYDTYYDFITREIAPKQITVTSDLRMALMSSEIWAKLIGAAGDIYGEGEKISATDLPLALDYAGETYGDFGTAWWGVCHVLGWSSRRNLIDNTTQSGAEAKREVLDSLAEGKPAYMSIAAASDTAGHAVAAIGYDAETDKFLIVDSAWQFDSDIIPMTYWCSFESIMYPAKRVEIFNFGEVISMTDIDNKLDAIMQIASFASKRGAFTPVAGTSVAVLTNAPANAKVIEIRAAGDAPNSTGVPASIAFFTCYGAPLNGVAGGIVKNANIEYQLNSKWYTSSLHADFVANSGGIEVTVGDPNFIFAAGKTYEWVAYGWDE